MDNASVLYAAWLMYLHYLMGPIPALHTFRSSFGPTVKPEYGRSAIGAERPILIPSIIYTYVDKGSRQAVNNRT